MSSSPPNRPIRVLRVITRLNIGGPSYQAIFLTERLNDQEFRSHLAIGTTSADEGNMEDLARERGVEFTRVAGLGREISLRSDGMTVARLYRIIRRYRPDIVHTHLAKAGAVGRLAAWMARVPAIVHTYHGHVFRGYFSPRKTEVFLRIERALARRTSRLVVLSENQRDDILGFGVGRPAQMAVIPLGLELDPFLTADELRGSLRRELGLPDDAPTVGIVARLVPIKAHDLFIRAAEQIADRIPNAQFVIVGDGETREDRVRQAIGAGWRVFTRSASGEVERHGPADGDAPYPQAAIHFLGFRSDLPNVYADLDVAVVCSHNEGMPVTIIEALTAARPVVATDVGAVRTLVMDGCTGRLVKPGSEAELADGIVGQLLNREEAHRMALAGRRHVYPRLSIIRLEADIRALYRDILKR